MNLTENEMSLLLKLQERNKGGKLTVINIERKSDREYDLSLTAVKTIDTVSCASYGWLPLTAISFLVTWTHPAVANMTDYPDMALNGDWSAVRDSSPEKIWAIFNRFVADKQF